MANLSCFDFKNVLSEAGYSLRMCPPRAALWFEKLLAWKKYKRGVVNYRQY